MANSAAVLKHTRHIIIDQDSIWVRWVKANLIRGTFGGCRSSKRPLGVGDIINSRKEARRLVFHIIGNGRSTSFGEDRWHLLGILAEHYSDPLSYNSYLHWGAKVRWWDRLGGGFCNTLYHMRRKFSRGYNSSLCSRFWEIGWSGRLACLGSSHSRVHIMHSVR